MNLKRIKIEGLDSYVIKNPNKNILSDVVYSLNYNDLTEGQLMLIRNTDNKNNGLDLDVGFTFALSAYENGVSVKPFTDFNQDYNMSSLDSMFDSVGSGIINKPQLVGCNTIKIDFDGSNGNFETPKNLYEKLKSLNFDFHGCFFNISDVNGEKDYNVFFGPELAGIQSSDNELSVNIAGIDWFKKIIKKHYK